MPKPKEKKATKPKAEKAEEKPKLDYHLEVHVNDLVYKGQAETLEQALTDFVNSPNFPFSVKTRMFMKFGKEGEELQTRTYPVFVARRLLKRISFRESALEILANKLHTIG